MDLITGGIVLIKGIISRRFLHYKREIRVETDNQLHLLSPLPFLTRTHKDETWRALVHLYLTSKYVYDSRGVEEVCVCVRACVIHLIGLHVALSRGHQEYKAFVSQTHSREDKKNNKIKQKTIYTHSVFMYKYIVIQLYHTASDHSN